MDQGLTQYKADTYFPESLIQIISYCWILMNLMVVMNHVLHRASSTDDTNIPPPPLSFSSEIPQRPALSRISTAASAKSGEDAVLRWGLLLIPIATFCLGTWQVNANAESEACSVKPLPPPHCLKFYLRCKLYNI